MSIYARCCGKDHVSSKRKCVVCGKSFHKYIVKVKDSVSGKWRTKTVPTLKLAKDVEVKFKTEILEGNVFNKKKHGGICFKRYLEYAKLHKISWKDDESRWNKHVKHHNFLTQAGITNILSCMRSNDLAPATVDHVYKLIKRVYNWSIENDYYCEQNPCRTIKVPKYDNIVTNYLCKEQIEELLDSLDSWGNVRASNVISFALYTGRRKGEILNLKWNDVDFEEKSITCRNTKNGKTISFPLNKKAYAIIEKALDLKTSDYVFPSLVGSHYYQAFNTSWRKFKKRIGLNYRFHDLRHTYASHLASSGKVDIYTLKTLLGHQDISLTMRYAHLTNEAVKKATCVLDDIF